MQIKFLTLFENNDHSRIQAQSSLLSEWQKSPQLRNMKLIAMAKVEFKDYSFFEYPDQAKAKQEVSSTYGYKNMQTNVVEYWWEGDRYPDLETLYKALAEQKRFMFMELTFEVEEWPDQL